MNIVAKNMKTVKFIPGTIDHDFLKGSKDFLTEKSKQLSVSNVSDTNPAPLKVLKDKDGFYIRRSLVGTPEGYQKISNLYVDFSYLI